MTCPQRLGILGEGAPTGVDLCAEAVETVETVELQWSARLLSRRHGTTLALAVCGALAAVLAVLCPAPAEASQTTIHNADPSVIRVGGTYISAESAGGGIAVREASSPAALGSAASHNCG